MVVALMEIARTGQQPDVARMDAALGDRTAWIVRAGGRDAHILQPGEHRAAILDAGGHQMDDALFAALDDAVDQHQPRSHHRAPVRLEIARP